jgi:uncharacterized protein YraI
MTALRLISCVAMIGLLSAASAEAAPAYVLTNVNLREAAGTTNAVLAKIPAGSLVDANNCTEWCEVTWQDRHGFVIATSLDRSGRVPVRRTAAPAPVAGEPIVADGAYLAAPPPAVVVAPYPYYGPYYRGYGGRYGYYGHGYGYGYRRWR